MADSILLIGDSGGGKTYAAITALLAGKNVRVLSAEGNCLPVVKKFLKDYEGLVKAGKAKPLREGQFAVCVPEKPKRSFADFAQTQLGTLAKSAETAFKMPNLTRAKFTGFSNICQATAAFIDLNGVNYGTVDSWGEDTVLVVDSLTAICESVWSHVVGDKVTPTQAEWGTMQGVLMQLLLLLTEGLGCNFVLIAHPNKEVDPNLGVTRIYPSNIGQALNTRIPAKFSEVVWCYRVEEKGEMKYYWSTKDRLCVTRHTNLPCSDKIPQDFGLIFKD
jgi:hypothetical protein